MAPRYENMTRADQVRARRSIEPARRKPIPQPEKYSRRNAESSARVTVRRSDQSMAKPTSAAYSQHRRKYYVPAGAPGTEIRLPALPTVKLSWRLASALLAILALVGIYMVNSSPNFMVSSINLSGAVRVSAQEILNTIDLEGTQIIKLTPEQIRQKIAAAFPDVEDVQVSVDFPAEVKVAVKERIPAITWYENDTPSIGWMNRATASRSGAKPAFQWQSMPPVSHPDPWGIKRRKQKLPKRKAQRPHQRRFRRLTPVLWKWY